MIAITIATPDFADMANENAQWFKRNSGMEVIVLHSNATTMEDGFSAKLELDKIHKGKVVFFDADYRLVSDVKGVIQSWDVSGRIIGVQETSAEFGDKRFFPYADSVSLSLPAHKHLNTGFLVCDTSSTMVKDVFADARQICAERSNGLWSQISDRTDQTIINLAIHRRQARVSLRPIEWNWFYYAFREGWTYFPQKIIGLHAAGVFGAKAKQEHLDAATKMISIPR